MKTKRKERREEMWKMNTKRKKTKNERWEIKTNTKKAVNYNLERIKKRSEKTNEVKKRQKEGKDDDIMSK